MEINENYDSLRAKLEELGDRIPDSVRQSALETAIMLELAGAVAQKVFPGQKTPTEIIMVMHYVLDRARVIEFQKEDQTIAETAQELIRKVQECEAKG